MTVLELIKRLDEYPVYYLVELAGNDTEARELRVLYPRTSGHDGFYAVWSPDETGRNPDDARGWVPA